MPRPCAILSTASGFLRGGARYCEEIELLAFRSRRTEVSSETILSSHNIEGTGDI